MGEGGRGGGGVVQESVDACNDHEWVRVSRCTAAVKVSIYITITSGHCHVLQRLECACEDHDWLRLSCRFVARSD